MEVSLALKAWSGRREKKETTTLLPSVVSTSRHGKSLGFEMYTTKGRKGSDTRFVPLESCVRDFVSLPFCLLLPLRMVLSSRDVLAFRAPREQPCEGKEEEDVNGLD